MTSRPEENPAVRVLQAEFTYSGQRVPALAEVSLEVPRGEVVALLGPSGAGKTTLFSCLTGLLVPDRGIIEVAGRPWAQASPAELRLARREVGLIFQQFNLIRRLTAEQNVLAGRLGHVSAWRVLLRRFGARDRELAQACLAQVGLSAQGLQRADRLSGGQQQRVAIARALAQEASLVLADEPVASLDPETAADVLATLRTVARERGLTVLASLHQVDLAVGFADRILGLSEGRLVIDTSVAHFSATDYERLYGRPSPSSAASAVTALRST